MLDSSKGGNIWFSPSSSTAWLGGPHLFKGAGMVQLQLSFPSLRYSFVKQRKTVTLCFQLRGAAGKTNEKPGMPGNSDSPELSAQLSFLEGLKGLLGPGWALPGPRSPWEPFANNSSHMSCSSCQTP